MIPVQLFQLFHRPYPESRAPLAEEVIRILSAPGSPHSVSTRDLVETLWPVKASRGPDQVAARKRMVRTILDMRSRELNGYHSRGKTAKDRLWMGRRVYPTVWHAYRADAVSQRKEEIPEEVGVEELSLLRQCAEAVRAASWVEAAGAIAALDEIIREPSTEE